MNGSNEYADQFLDQVVVGFDGSDHAQRAVAWAAREAYSRSLQLTVLSAAHFEAIGLGGATGMASWWPEAALGGSRWAADAGVQLARDVAPGVVARPWVGLGSPGALLVAASQTAREVVVGSRGRNPVVQLCLGSVAEAVAAHGHCPVVVVHGDDSAQPGPEHPVVVGYDGSLSSRVALEYGADAALRAGARLRIVTAWDADTAQTWVVAYGGTGMPSWQDVLREGHDTADQVARRGEELARDAHPGLQVTRVVEQGRPSLMLAAAAADAGMLVVGTRGRGALASALLGSVSHTLVRTSPCPVAVTATAAESDATAERPTETVAASL